MESFASVVLVRTMWVRTLEAPLSGQGELVLVCVSVSNKPGLQLSQTPCLHHPASHTFVKPADHLIWKSANFKFNNIVKASLIVTADYRQILKKGECSSASYV